MRCQKVRNMYTSRYRTPHSIFKILPTMMLAAALIVLIVAQLFDANIQQATSKNIRIHDEVDASQVDAGSDSQASVRDADA
jgi:hypothetical protein